VRTPNLLNATWRKSTYSAANGTCVEIAVAESVVGVRDSKKADAGHLTVPAAVWNAFVAAVRDES
jgi:hypothetical protein